MGKSRFYSLALGIEKNFEATTAGLVAESNTSPDVSLYSLLYFNNTTNNVGVTGFTNSDEGQIIHCINLGSPIAFVGTDKFVQTASGYVEVNGSITFIKGKSKYYEVSRSDACGCFGIVTSNCESAATILSTTKVLVLTGTKPIAIKGISGGYDGQTIQVVKTGSCPNYLNNQAAIWFGGTADSIVMHGSANATITRSGGKWYLENQPDVYGAETIVTNTHTNSNPTITNSTKVLVLPGTAKLLILGISGGYEGQQLLIIKQGSCYNTISCGAAAGCIIASSTANNLVLNASDSILVTRYNKAWYVPLYACYGVA